VGSVLVRVRRHGQRADVEIVVVDSGPGVDDIEAAFEDGVSTRGTLGIGLGAVRRLANSLTAVSTLRQGSILCCTMSAHSDDEVARLDVDGLTRPFAGEAVCGDAWSSATEPGRISLLLADGLGHGELAAVASREAVATFDADPMIGPLSVIEACHRRLGPTRGAAVLAVDIDRERGVLRWCGVGNVIGRIVDFERSKGLISQPGIVGHRIGRLREETLSLPAGAALAVHSDGLTDKWGIEDWAVAAGHGPTVLCAALLRAAGLRRDDASVIAVTT